MLRSHGVLSSHAKARTQVVPHPDVATMPARVVQLALFGDNESTGSEPPRRPWAWLLRHVFGEDLQSKAAQPHRPRRKLAHRPGLLLWSERSRAHRPIGRTRHASPPRRAIERPRRLSPRSRHMAAPHETRWSRSSSTPSATSNDCTRRARNSDSSLFIAASPRLSARPMTITRSFGSSFNVAVACFTSSSSPFSGWSRPVMDQAACRSTWCCKALPRAALRSRGFRPPAPSRARCRGDRHRCR